MAKRVVHKSEERVDSKTGEIVRTGYAIIVDRPKGDKDFVKIFKCFTQKVLDDLEIESGKAKLLFWFIDQVQEMKINQEPVIIATVEMISNDLKCAEISIRKWLALLIEKGYIRRHLTPNGKILHNMYIINPGFVIKGKLSDMEDNP